MPSGHTEKQTMTHYRANLLDSLPVDKRTLRDPKRFQLGNCISFGWAQEGPKGIVTITEQGRAAVWEFRKQHGHRSW